MTARSAACRCESNFTCGHCLRNAPPYFFTGSSGYAVAVPMDRRPPATPCPGCDGYHSLATGCR